MSTICSRLHDIIQDGSDVVHAARADVLPMIARMRGKPCLKRGCCRRRRAQRHYSRRPMSFSNEPNPPRRYLCFIKPVQRAHREDFDKHGAAPCPSFRRQVRAKMRSATSVAVYSRGRAAIYVFVRQRQRRAILWRSTLCRWRERDYDVERRQRRAHVAGCRIASSSRLEIRDRGTGE